MTAAFQSVCLLSSNSGATCGSDSHCVKFVDQSRSMYVERVVQTCRAPALGGGGTCAQWYANLMSIVNVLLTLRIRCVMARPWRMTRVCDTMWKSCLGVNLLVCRFEDQDAYSKNPYIFYDSLSATPHLRFCLRPTDRKRVQQSGGFISASKHDAR